MRSHAIRALNLVIAAALMAAVLITTRPWEVWRLDAAFIGGFAAALVLDGALVVVWAHRHALVLRAVGAEVRPGQLGWIVTFANTANNLTPAASGEVVRAWFLNREFSISYHQGGAAIVFERVFMLGLMGLSALAAGLLAVGSSVWLLLLTMAGLGVYVFAMPSMLAPFTSRLRREVGGGRFRKMAYAVSTGGLRLWSDRRVALRTALWSVAAFAAQGLIFYIAARLSGLDLTGLETWALLGGATAAGVISALPFGLGVAELSAVGIGALLGLDTQLVAASFVLFRVFFTLPLAMAGAIAYGRLTAIQREPDLDQGNMR